MAAQVQSLRELLEQRFPSAVPLPSRVASHPTGVAALDAALPGGGLPRGRVTSWTPGAGTTAVLRSACQRVVAGGERAVWIDGAGTLTGEGWMRGPLLVRPRTRPQALESTEEMLRSGAVALVVLTGCDPSGPERVRLGRAVREGGSALVVVGGGYFPGSVRVSTDAEPGDYRWEVDAHGEPAAVAGVRVHVRVSAQGWERGSEFTLAVRPYELRLSLDAGLADRRGVAR